MTHKGCTPPPSHPEYVGKDPRPDKPYRQVQNMDRFTSNQRQRFMSLSRIYVGTPFEKLKKYLHKTSI